MKTKASNKDLPRVIAVLLTALAQVIFAGLPQLLNWEHSVSSRSYEAQTLIVPAGYAFAIWSLLFLGCIIYAIVHALPKNRRDPSFRKTGWLAATAFGLNAIWELYVPLYGLDIGNLIIILIILIALISILFYLKALDEKRTIFIPLKALAGWISVASFVSISVTCNFEGFNPFQLSGQNQTIILLFVAGAITTFFGFYFKSVYYNIPTFWGFAAIYVINQGRGEETIAMLALIMGILGFMFSLFRHIFSYLSKKKKAAQNYNSEVV